MDSELKESIGFQEIQWRVRGLMIDSKDSKVFGEGEGFNIVRFLDLMYVK